MNFESERALVEKYQSYLLARGIRTQSEVSCGKGFAADLVSTGTVWECKLILDRDHIYQALGQGESYRKYLQLPKLAIFGLAPDNKKQFARSQRLAQWLTSIHSHLWIGFVDHDPGFQSFCSQSPKEITKHVDSIQPATTSTAERTRNRINQLIALSQASPGAL